MKSYQNLGEVVADLATLSNDLWSLKKDVERASGVAFESQDARLVALDAVQSDLIACGYWINAALSLERDCRERFGERGEPELRKRLGVGPGFPGHPIGGEKGPDVVMIDYLRHSLTVMIHFRVDALFSNLLRKLGKNIPSGFLNRARETLAASGVARGGYEAKVLTAFAHVRNSFHNNGIHGQGDDTVVIGRVSFEFRCNQKVRCDSWAHLLLLIRETVKVLRTILLCRTISGLHEVRDGFAAGSVP
jgi:hypothetical protein